MNSAIRNQTIALAGMYLAVKLVQQTAQGERRDIAATKTSIGSIKQPTFMPSSDSLTSTSRSLSRILIRDGSSSILLLIWNAERSVTNVRCSAVRRLTPWSNPRPRTHTSSGIEAHDNRSNWTAVKPSLLDWACHNRIGFGSARGGPLHPTARAIHCLGQCGTNHY